MATSAEQRDSGAPTDPNYLLEVDRPLVLPVGKKVRVLLTSTDVIHAWWIPSFGIKQDAVPGFLRETWVKIDRPGIYRGPMRRTLRRRPRFHAKRRRGEGTAGFRQVACRCADGGGAGGGG
ncbi:MAG: hypothetical protein WDN29_00315 [Methylovirgula sp.]